MMHHHVTLGCKTFNKAEHIGEMVLFWGFTLTMTWTLKAATQSFRMAVLLMMHHLDSEDSNPVFLHGCPADDDAPPGLWRQQPSLFAWLSCWWWYTTWTLKTATQSFCMAVLLMMHHLDSEDSNPVFLHGRPADDAPPGLWRQQSSPFAWPSCWWCTTWTLKTAIQSFCMAVLLMMHHLDSEDSNPVFLHGCPADDAPPGLWRQQPSLFAWLSCWWWYTTWTLKTATQSFCMAFLLMMIHHLDSEDSNPVFLHGFPADDDTPPGLWRQQPSLFAWLSCWWWYTTWTLKTATQSFCMAVLLLMIHHLDSEDSNPVFLHGFPAADDTPPGLWRQQPSLFAWQSCWWWYTTWTLKTATQSFCMAFLLLMIHHLDSEDSNPVFLHGFPADDDTPPGLWRQQPSLFAWPSCWWWYTTWTLKTATQSFCMAFLLLMIHHLDSEDSNPVFLHGRPADDDTPPGLWRQQPSLFAWLSCCWWYTTWTLKTATQSFCMAFLLMMIHHLDSEDSNPVFLHGRPADDDTPPGLWRQQPSLFAWLSCCWWYTTWTLKTATQSFCMAVLLLMIHHLDSEDSNPVFLHGSPADDDTPPGLWRQQPSLFAWLSCCWWYTTWTLKTATQSFCMAVLLLMIHHLDSENSNPVFLHGFPAADDTPPGLWRQQPSLFAWLSCWWWYTTWTLKTATQSFCMAVLLMMIHHLDSEDSNPVFLHGFPAADDTPPGLWRQQPSLFAWPSCWWWYTTWTLKTATQSFCMAFLLLMIHHLDSEDSNPVFLHGRPADDDTPPGLWRQQPSLFAWLSCCWWYTTWTLKTATQSFCMAVLLMMIHHLDSEDSNPVFLHGFPAADDTPPGLWRQQPSLFAWLSCCWWYTTWTLKTATQSFCMAVLLMMIHHLDSEDSNPVFLHGFPADDDTPPGLWRQQPSLFAWQSCCWWYTTWTLKTATQSFCMAVLLMMIHHLDSEDSNPVFLHGFPAADDTPPGLWRQQPSLFAWQSCWWWYTTWTLKTATQSFCMAFLVMMIHHLDSEDSNPVFLHGSPAADDTPPGLWRQQPSLFAWLSWWWWYTTWTLKTATQSFCMAFLLLMIHHLDSEDSNPVFLHGSPADDDTPPGLWRQQPSLFAWQSCWWWYTTWTLKTATQSFCMAFLLMMIHHLDSEDSNPVFLHGRPADDDTPPGLWRQQPSLFAWLSCCWWYTTWTLKTATQSFCMAVLLMMIHHLDSEDSNPVFLHGFPAADDTPPGLWRQQPSLFAWLSCWWWYTTWTLKTATQSFCMAVLLMMIHHLDSEDSNPVFLHGFPAADDTPPGLWRQQPSLFAWQSCCWWYTTWTLKTATQSFCMAVLLMMIHHLDSEDSNPVFLHGFPAADDTPPGLWRQQPSLFAWQSCCLLKTATQWWYTTWTLKTATQSFCMAFLLMILDWRQQPSDDTPPGLWRQQPSLFAWLSCCWWYTTWTLKTATQSFCMAVLLMMIHHLDSEDSNPVFLHGFPAADDTPPGLWRQQPSLFAWPSCWWWYTTWTLKTATQSFCMAFLLLMIHHLDSEDSNPVFLHGRPADDPAEDSNPVFLHGFPAADDTPPGLWRQQPSLFAWLSCCWWYTTWTLKTATQSFCMAVLLWWYTTWTLKTATQSFWHGTTWTLLLAVMIHHLDSEDSNPVFLHGSPADDDTPPGLWRQQPSLFAWLSCCWWYTTWTLKTATQSFCMAVLLMMIHHLDSEDSNPVFLHGFPGDDDTPPGLWRQQPSLFAWQSCCWWYTTWTLKTATQSFCMAFLVMMIHHLDSEDSNPVFLHGFPAADDTPPGLWRQQPSLFAWQSCWWWYTTWTLKTATQSFCMAVLLMMIHHLDSEDSNPVFLHGFPADDDTPPGLWRQQPSLFAWLSCCWWYTTWTLKTATQSFCMAFLLMMIHHLDSEDSNPVFLHGSPAADDTPPGLWRQQPSLFAWLSCWWWYTTWTLKTATQSFCMAVLLMMIHHLDSEDSNPVFLHGFPADDDTPPGLWRQQPSLFAWLSCWWWYTTWTLKTATQSFCMAFLLMMIHHLMIHHLDSEDSNPVFLHGFPAADDTPPGLWRQQPSLFAWLSCCWWYTTWTLKTATQSFCMAVLLMMIHHLDSEDSNPVFLHGFPAADDTPPGLWRQQPSLFAWQSCCWWYTTWTLKTATQSFCMAVLLMMIHHLDSEDSNPVFLHGFPAADDTPPGLWRQQPSLFAWQSCWWWYTTWTLKTATQSFCMAFLVMMIHHLDSEDSNPVFLHGSPAADDTPPGLWRQQPSLFAWLSWWWWYTTWTLKTATQSFCMAFLLLMIHHLDSEDSNPVFLHGSPADDDTPPGLWRQQPSLFAWQSCWWWYTTWTLKTATQSFCMAFLLMMIHHLDSEDSNPVFLHGFPAADDTPPGLWRQQPSLFAWLSWWWWYTTWTLKTATQSFCMAVLLLMIHHLDSEDSNPVFLHGFPADDDTPPGLWRQQPSLFAWQSCWWWYTTWTLKTATQSFCMAFLLMMIHHLDSEDSNPVFLHGFPADDDTPPGLWRQQPSLFAWLSWWWWYTTWTLKTATQSFCMAVLLLMIHHLDSEDSNPVFLHGFPADDDTPPGLWRQQPSLFAWQSCWWWYTTWTLKTATQSFCMAFLLMMIHHLDSEDSNPVFLHGFPADDDTPPGLWRQQPSLFAWLSCWWWYTTWTLKTATQSFCMAVLLMMIHHLDSEDSNPVFLHGSPADAPLCLVCFKLVSSCIVPSRQPHGVTEDV